MHAALLYEAIHTATWGDRILDAAQCRERVREREDEDRERDPQDAAAEEARDDPRRKLCARELHGHQHDGKDENDECQHGRGQCGQRHMPESSTSRVSVKRGSLRKGFLDGGPPRHQRESEAVVDHCKAAAGPTRWSADTCRKSANSIERRCVSPVSESHRKCHDLRSTPPSKNSVLSCTDWATFGPRRSAESRNFPMKPLAERAAFTLRGYRANSGLSYP